MPELYQTKVNELRGGVPEHVDAPTSNVRLAVRSPEVEPERATDLARAASVVWVVDSDRLIYAQIAAARSKAGQTVVKLPADTDFCNRIDSELVSMIVLELCPDGLPRFELLCEFRQSWPQARIVVLTAYPSYHAAVTATRLGADEYLAKPVSLLELMRALQGDAGFTAQGALPSLKRVEWEYIARVLGYTDGNISEAARVLGIERSTLQRKLRKRPPTK